MRAAPAIRIEVTRFGVWRLALFILLALAGVNLLVWVWLARPWSIDGGSPFAAGGIAAIALAAASSVARAGRSFCLSFDGAGWQLKFAAAADISILGRVRPALDLGAWMLLRFEPAAPDAGARAFWLPIQRAGLEAHWHALRSAVYCARPAPSPPPATAASAGSDRPE